MFGFNKKKKHEDKPKKKQSGLDKILMGMIVGGAIGSVLGVGLAPKKGSETRKDLGKQAGKLLKSARDTAGKLMKNPPQNHLVKPETVNKFGKRSIPDEK